MKKGPDSIFRDDSNVTDTNLKFHMVNYDNIMSENLCMSSWINAKQTLIGNKAIQEVVVADATGSTKLFLWN